MTPHDPRPGIAGRAVRVIAGVIGAPAARFGGVPGVLARRNTMRRPGRTGSTALALTIGVTLVAAVAIVVSGLKGTASTQVADHISADYVVASQEQGWGPASREALHAVAAAPGVRRVGAVVLDRARVGTDEATVAGVDRAATSMFRYDIKSGAAGPGGVPGPGEAYVADRYAEGARHRPRRPHHAALGDRWAGHRAGARRSRRQPAIDVLERRRRDAAVGGVPVRVRRRSSRASGWSTPPAAPRRAQQAAIAHAMRAFPGAYVQDPKRWGEDQASWLDQVLAIIVVMLALAVVVSLLGIVNTLALSVVERTREIGLLRAAGMTRRQVRRMVRWESVLTALVGAGLGIAAGLALAAVVTALLADQGLAFVLPVGFLAAIALVAAGAGVVAAVIPARRAGRMDVLAAVTVD